MESKDKMDEIQLEIEQLVDEKKESDTLIEEHKLQQLEPTASRTEKAKSEEVNDSISESDERKKIIKDLKKIKRQNFFTQCLLSAMIVLTLTWQVSEVSLIWKVKNGIYQPFKSFRTMFDGVLKGPNQILKQNGDKQNSSKQLEDEGTLIPPIKVPQLLGLDSDKKSPSGFTIL